MNKTQETNVQMRMSPEAGALFHKTSSVTYEVDGATVTCILGYREDERRSVDTYGVWVMKGDACYCAVSRLSIEEGERLCAFLKRHRVSPVHVRDVLEDAAVEDVSGRLWGRD